jgi:hypothetical protein
MAMKLPSWDDLDRVPWSKLEHAYGSAEDVPELLRELRTAPPSRGEGPLWHLFGNIYHQGTVYEATAHAVPFLIKLAADKSTPDRVGVLELLACIASGDSTRWEKTALDAIALGFDVYVKITREHSDVRLAAAHVLAQLPEHSAEVAGMIRQMLKAETRGPQRAGLVLLLGQTHDSSSESVAELVVACNHADRSQRRAAAIAIAGLKLPQTPAGAVEAIIEALKLTEEDLQPFDGLPWNATGDVECGQAALPNCLEPGDRQRACLGLIADIEKDTDTVAAVQPLIDLLFPIAKRGPTRPLTARTLSPLQQQAVRAMYAKMKRGKRIFYGHFPQFGLPDTMREWAALAAGHEPEPVDMTLPILAAPTSPRKLLRPDRVKVGDEVIHRHFGKGIVRRVAIDKSFARMTVCFDVEGTKDLCLPSDGRM